MDPGSAMRLAILSGAAALAVPALAQQPPAAPQQPVPQARPAPDPRMLAAQQAFEALPEAERRAIQQDLGFAAAFNGAALGGFGPLTFQAIQAFEREKKLTVDGTLTPDERKLLAGAAAAARQTLRFAVIDDERSRARIGVPQSVFVKREANAIGGSRWQTADGKATLDTVAAAPGGETLAQLFDKATAPAANRKVTYKLSRPDFFVVTAETAGGKSYRRMTQGPDGAIRGFAVGYDKALAGAMDRLVIAVANSFEAFPGLAPAPAVAAARPVQPQAPAPPRERLASGLLLDGGFVLTADAAARDCRTLAVGPRRAAARVVAADVSVGLALLKADGLPRGTAMALAGPVAAAQTLTAVAQAWSGTQSSAVFSEAIAAGADRIGAPLQSGGAGAALFDAEGRLAGLVVDDPGARRQVAGVVPAARYRFAGSEAIGAFLRRNGADAARGQHVETSGGVAAQRRDAVVALICGLGS